MPVRQADTLGKKEFKAELGDNGLKYIPMVFSNVPEFLLFPHHPKPGRSVQQHLDLWKAQVAEALSYEPVKINSHSGADYFYRDEQLKFFSEAVKFQKGTNIPILHETHRARILHSPWVAREIVPQFPELKITADLSHWICVAEAPPDDPELNTVIQAIAPHVEHIHARVGYEHGPQVPDPRAKYWEGHTNAFFKWWGLIWKEQLKKGLKESTFEPEHGPANYQVVDPNTLKPLADVFEVNTWIGEEGKKLFESGVWKK